MAVADYYHSTGKSFSALILSGSTDGSDLVPDQVLR